MVNSMKIQVQTGQFASIRLRSASHRRPATLVVTANRLGRCRDVSFGLFSRRRMSSNSSFRENGRWEGTGWHSYCRTGATPYFVGFGGYCSLVGLGKENNLRKNPKESASRLIFGKSPNCLLVESGGLGEFQRGSGSRFSRAPALWGGCMCDIGRDGPNNQKCTIWPQSKEGRTGKITIEAGKHGITTKSILFNS